MRGNFFKFTKPDGRNKLLIVGESGSGKTSLKNRYLKKSFRGNELMTVGIEYSTTQVEIQDREVDLDIYDIAGQEGFEVRKKLFSNFHGAMIVFDLSRHSTFFTLRRWVDELITINPKHNIPLMIIGNKSDLKRQREIPSKEVELFIDTLKSDREVHSSQIEYVETSAKTGENVIQAFETMADHISNFNN